MRSRVFFALGLLLAAACGPDGGPTAVPDEEARLRVTAFVAGTPVATLVVDVSATDIPTPLLFNLQTVDGVAAGTLKLPPGTARTIHVSAYDDTGELTHEGSAVVDVRPGSNPPVTITLRGRSGQVPITVTFGEVSVIVAPTAINVQDGLQTVLEATVIDVDGNAIPAAVEWATSNPAFATVDAAGTVTGVLPGVVTIAATFEGVGGFAEVTVTSGPVGTVAGIVSSDVLGPIEGAQVTVGLASATTDASGVYSIPLVPAGLRTVQLVGPLPVTCTPPADIDVEITPDVGAIADFQVSCGPDLTGVYTGTAVSVFDATVNGLPVGMSSQTVYGCDDPCPASANVTQTSLSDLSGTVSVGTSTLTAAFVVTTDVAGTSIALVPFNQVYAVQANGFTVPVTCQYSTPVPAPVPNPAQPVLTAVFALSCSGSGSGLNVLMTGTTSVTLDRTGD